MIEHVARLKAALSAVLAAMTALWGWFGWLLIVWIGLMLADWLVGSAAAAHRGEWSSAKLREGAAGVVSFSCGRKVPSGVVHPLPFLMLLIWLKGIWKASIMSRRM